MGWLIEMLIEGIQERCSQFIIDMMEVITEMFTELLSCNLSLFEELFSVVGALYKSMVVPLAVALLLLILTWQLFKSMFGKAGLSGEDPIELVLRSGACLFMIVGAKSFVNYILTVAGTPYQWVVGTDIKVSSFSEYVSSLEGVTAVLGIDSVSTLLLTLIMQLVVAWNYFKMLFVVAERYVLLGVFSYTAPLAFATGGSKSTNNILSSWAKMFGGQVVLIIMNAWCMKMFLSGYGNMLASGYGFTKFFVATLCLIGFCKITFKLDTYMASLGVNLGRPSGGMGAMGLVMAANRIFSSFRGTSSGGSQPSGGPAMEHDSGSQMGAQDMTNGFTQPIPMSADGNTGSGGIETENAETDHTNMEETGTDENNSYESETDSVLEVLGGMPSERSGEAGLADTQGTHGTFDGDEERESEDISQMQEVLGNGNGNAMIGNGIEEHHGIGKNEDTSERQDVQNENPEASIIEVLNQGNSIDGIGDYPVRHEQELEDEGEEIPIDMESPVIGEPIAADEAKTGSAGPAYDQTLSGGQYGERTGQVQDADILQELGVSSPLDVTVAGEAAALDSMHGSLGSVAGDSSIDMNASHIGHTTEGNRVSDPYELKEDGIRSYGHYESEEKGVKGFGFINSEESSAEEAGFNQAGESDTVSSGFPELAESGIVKTEDNGIRSTFKDALDKTGEEIEAGDPDTGDAGFDMNMLEPVPETVPEDSGRAGGEVMHEGSNEESNYHITQEQDGDAVIPDDAHEDFPADLMRMHDVKKYEDTETPVEDVPEMLERADAPRIGSMDDEEPFPL